MNWEMFYVRNHLFLLCAYGQPNLLYVPPEDTVYGTQSRLAESLFRAPVWRLCNIRLGRGTGLEPALVSFLLKKGQSNSSRAHFSEIAERLLWKSRWAISTVYWKFNLSHMDFGITGYSGYVCIFVLILKVAGLSSECHHNRVHWPTLKSLIWK